MQLNSSSEPLIEEINLKNLFKVFLKIGIILLGGGYVIIPIMKTELIEKRNWLQEDELLDFYCVSQCLSGIIAVNMAILVGYRLLKFKGALVSLFAMSFSPFISIVLIANILDKIIKIPFMEGVFFGVNLCVIVLIYLTLKEMWKKSITDIFSIFWFLLILSLAIFKVNPAFLIIFSILFGVLIELFKRIRGDKNA